MMKTNQPYEFVLTGFDNTDNVSHQNFFIWPHLSEHAGQNDMFCYNLLWNIMLLQVLMSEYQI